MNDRDFFAQLAQLGTVQGVEQLTKNTQISQGATLIGRRVEVFSTMTENGVANTTVNGIVEGVEVANGKVHITINGARYPMDRLIRILG